MAIRVANAAVMVLFNTLAILLNASASRDIGIGRPPVRLEIDGIPEPPTLPNSGVPVAADPTP
ncbi:MAG: hypothetical protein PHN49_02005, partial [Candidatus Omnitrophica bacterium]|nr:hypothetical protein [Candidatus Omnitrophota bacterium]